MAKHGRSLQALLLEEVQERDGRDQEITAAELMDPLYLEARLADARARRAEALKRRDRSEAPAPTLAFPVSPDQATIALPAASLGISRGAITRFRALAQSPLAVRIGVPAAVFAIGLISGAAIMWNLAGTDRTPGRTAGAVEAVAPDVVQASLSPRSDTPSPLAVPEAPSAPIEEAWTPALTLGEPKGATEFDAASGSSVVWADAGWPLAIAPAPAIATAWMGESRHDAELPPGVPPASGPAVAAAEFSIEIASVIDPPATVGMGPVMGLSGGPDTKVVLATPTRPGLTSPDSLAREGDSAAEIETTPAYPDPIALAEGVALPDGSGAVTAFGAPQPPIVGANGLPEPGQITVLRRAPRSAGDPGETQVYNGASIWTASLTTVPDLGPVNAPAGDAAFPFDPKAAVPALPQDSGMLFAGEAADIRVHYPPKGARSADEMVAALRASGAVGTYAVPVDFSISSTNVRYFHSEDKAAAEAAAKSLIAAGAHPEVRDFTDYRPQPAAGVVEIYLAGLGAESTAPAPTRTVSRTPSPANASAASRRAKVSELSRILLERRVESLLRARQGR